MAVRTLQIFVCVSLILGVFCELKDDDLFPIKDGYIQLDKHNFVAALHEFKFVFALYYGRNRESKKAESEMVKVCEHLRRTQSIIHAAKIDADRESEIVRVLPIQATPTFRLYKNGKRYDYHGKMEAEKLITWLDLAMMVPLQINTANELDSLVKSTCVILGCFPGKSPKEAFNNFYKVSEYFVCEPRLPLPRFAIITSAPLARQLGAGIGTISVYKKFEEGAKVTFTGDQKNFTQVLQFAEEETYPTVFKMHVTEYLPIMHQRLGTYQHILFMNSNDRGFQSVYDNFKRAAKHYKNQGEDYKYEVAFIHVDLKIKDQGEHIEYYHIDVSKDLPCSRITKFDKYHSRYLPPKQDLSYNGFKDFTDGVLNNRIQRHIRSQPLPSDWNAYDVKIVVGEGFEKFVYDKQRTVVMLYHIPNDPKSDEAIPVFNALAKEFRSNHTIVFGRMNIAENDGEVGDIAKSPCVKMFLPNGKSMMYKLDMKVEKLKTFIMTLGANQPKNEDFGDLLDYNYINLQHPAESVEEEERRKKQWEEEERKILSTAVTHEIAEEPFDEHNYKEKHPFEHLPLDERDPEYMDPKKHAEYAHMHPYQDLDSHEEL